MNQCGQVYVYVENYVFLIMVIHVPLFQWFHKAHYINFSHALLLLHFCALPVCVFMKGLGALWKIALTNHFVYGQNKNCVISLFFYLLSYKYSIVLK